MSKITKKQLKKELSKKAKRVTDADLEIVLKRKKEIEAKFSGDGPLSEFVASVKLFFSVMNDYYNKSYKNIPWWSIASIVTALLYVLNPLDLVPDMIPVIGVLDDTMIVSLCLKMVKKDLEKYKLWKIENA